MVVVSSTGRRESVDVEDIVHAHVGSMDAMARGLRAAHTLAAQGGGGLRM